MQEEIDYGTSRIILVTHGSGFKALIYSSGSAVAEEHIPHGKDRETVLMEAQQFIDLQLER